MNRDELLERESEAWSDFEAVILGVPPERRAVEGVVPGWSTHDLVWHCVYWVADVADALERLGRGAAEPEEPDDDALVAEILAQGRQMTWDEALERAEPSRERARAALSALADVPETAVVLFAGETFDHYEEHRGEISAFGERRDGN